MNKERVVDNLTFGADPEFFAFDDEELISADKLFPNKWEPHKFDDGQAVFFDGVQGEFNVNPATSAAELHANIMSAINQTKKDFKVKELKMVSTVEVDLEALKDADKECNRFGCQPDYNVYTMGEQHNEIDATKHKYRYAGGHLHIGNLPKEINDELSDTVRFIKALDVYVGVPSIIADHSKETIIRRSYHYGKAGSFRFQAYGIEYRVLSNYWVGNEKHTKAVIDGVHKAVDATIDGTIDKILKTFGEDEIQTIINTVNVDRARAFLKEIDNI